MPSYNLTLRPSEFKAMASCLIVSGTLTMCHRAKPQPPHTTFKLEQSSRALKPHYHRKSPSMDKAARCQVAFCKLEENMTLIEPSSASIFSKLKSLPEQSSALWPVRVSGSPACAGILYCKSTCDSACIHSIPKHRPNDAVLKGLQLKSSSGSEACRVFEMEMREKLEQERFSWAASKGLTSA